MNDNKKPRCRDYMARFATAKSLRHAYMVQSRSPPSISIPLIAKYCLALFLGSIVVVNLSEFGASAMKIASSHLVRYCRFFYDKRFPKSYPSLPALNNNTLASRLTLHNFERAQQLRHRLCIFVTIPGSNHGGYNQTKIFRFYTIKSLISRDCIILKGDYNHSGY